jgi:hypothetical protein
VSLARTRARVSVARTRARSLALAAVALAGCAWYTSMAVIATPQATATASDRPAGEANTSVAGHANAIVSSRANATLAKAIIFIANANLRVTKNHGSELDAQGPVTGTVDGYLKLKVNISSASRMTSRFVGSSSKGSIEGTAVSEYGVSGNTVYYTGVANITHGTGAYAHVNARGVHEEGSMDRKRKVGQMHISGHGSI